MAEKDSIEIVLEASKKAIPNNVAALLSHETVVWNFLDLIERATFSPEGSAHDKHLKAWMKFRQKIGSEILFPNPTTAANVNEAMRILLKERRTIGALSAALEFSVIWDSGIKSVQDSDSMCQLGPGSRMWTLRSSC